MKLDCEDLRYNEHLRQIVWRSGGVNLRQAFDVYFKAVLSQIGACDFRQSKDIFVKKSAPRIDVLTCTSAAMNNSSKLQLICRSSSDRVKIPNFGCTWSDKWENCLYLNASEKHQLRCQRESVLRRWIRACTLASKVNNTVGCHELPSTGLLLW